MKKRFKPITPKPEDGEELPSIEDIVDASAWEDRLAKARQLRAAALARRPEQDSGGMVTRARIGAAPTAADSRDIGDGAANSDDIESVEDILNTPNLNERFEKARIRHSQIQALKQVPHGPATRRGSGVDPAVPKKTVLFAFGGARGQGGGGETAAPVGPGIDAATAPSLAPLPTPEPAPTPAPQPTTPRRRITPVRIAAALVFALLVAVAIPGPVRSLTGGLIAGLRTALLAPPPTDAPVQQAALPAPTQTAPTQPAPPVPAQTPPVRVAPEPAPAAPAAPLVQTQSRDLLGPPATIDTVVDAAPAPAIPGVDVAVARTTPSLPDAPGLGAPPLVQTTTPPYRAAKKEAPARIGGTEVAASILSQDMAPRVAVLRSGSVAPFVQALRDAPFSRRPAAPIAAQPAPIADPVRSPAGAPPPTLSVGLAGGVPGRPAPLGRAVAGLPALPTGAAPAAAVAPVQPLAVPASPAALPFVELPPANDAAPSGPSVSDVARGENQPLSALVAMRAAAPRPPVPAGPDMALPARYATAGLPERPANLALGGAGTNALAQTAVPALRPAAPAPIKAAPGPAAPATVSEQAGVAPPTPEQAAVVLASFAPLPGTRPETAPVLHTLSPSTFIEPLIAPEHGLAGVGGAGQDTAALARFQVHVNAPRGVSQARLDGIVAALRDIGYPIGAPNRVALLIRKSNVRYFYPSDLGAAVELAAVVGATARDFTGYSPKPPPGTIEIWMAGGPTAPSRSSPAKPPTATAPEADQDPALMALRNRLINSLRRGDILQQPGQ